MCDNFYETDHWKLLATAKRFLLAAEVLRRSEEYRVSEVLFTPVLHLAGHGIEVLLKANLVGSGLTVEDVKNHGHDISSLWTHEFNELLRNEAKAQATMAWRQAQSDGSWGDNFEEGDPEFLLEEYLAALSILHTKESKFALRYIAASDMVGPRPHLLVETFLPLSDLCARQPRLLVPVAG